ncbi:hypothetical protein D3C72_2335240 [compost metagenome]
MDLEMDAAHKQINRHEQDDIQLPFLDGDPWAALKQTLVGIQNHIGGPVQEGGNRPQYDTINAE